MTSQRERTMEMRNTPGIKKMKSPSKKEEPLEEQLFEIRLKTYFN